MSNYIYTPRDIRKMDDKAIRSTYSKLRSVANKRIQRIKAAGLSGLLERGAELFPKLSEVSASAVPGLLADVSYFLRSFTQLKQVRARAEEFKAHVKSKYPSISMDTYEQVGEFWQFVDRLREKYGAKNVDSGDALDVYEQGERLGIPEDALVKYYAAWAEKMSVLKNIEPMGEDGMSMDEVEELIREWGYDPGEFGDDEE